MSPIVYTEKFKDGPGGWYGWISNTKGPKPLEYKFGNVTSRSPWWIDYNHAPPGLGYLHMVFCLGTAGPQSEALMEVGGPNRFISGGFSTDLREAKITAELSGELIPKGANLVLLVQGNVEGIISGWLHTGSSFTVGLQPSRHTLVLESDPSLWAPLGARHDRTDMYGVKPLTQVLASVNVNIMLVLFPLDISPMGPIGGDMHLLRPERDYPVWRHRLPEGYISLNEIQIEFA